LGKVGGGEDEEVRGGMRGGRRGGNRGGESSNNTGEPSG